MKQILFVIIAVTGLLFAGNQVMSLDDVMQPENSIEVQPKETRTAVFAGGCFWCTESDFEKIDGVVQAISGYTGGHVDHPTYKQVSAGGTGHVEAVKVIYDPAKIQYEDLLEVLWRSINPTDPGGQFVDRGPQYRSAIFYADERQRQLAKASKEKLGAAGIFDLPIATEILPLKKFYEAEAYHQDYYKKNPIRYKWYRSGSGRDQFLEGVWADRPVALEENRMESNTKKMGNDHRLEQSVEDRGYNKPSDAVLQKRLTPLQYNVTQKNATERPFQNAFWNHHEAGIYVDIVSGEPLFSSMDKFNSGTGWPSFTRPLEPANIVEKSDRSLFMVRTEVRSRHAESHLGHLFNDGPQPTGLRYCINSAALRFIPEDNLEKEGYGKYAGSFKEMGMTTGKAGG